MYFLITHVILLLMLFVWTLYYSPFHIGYSESPIVREEGKYEITKIASNLDSPSGMEIIDNDVLIIEKNNGKIMLVRDFDMKKYPIDRVDSFSSERDNGLMGISSIKENNLVYLFLYFSEKSDQGNPFVDAGLSNRVYRYIWNSSGLELTNKTLLLDIPITPSSPNSGGRMALGPDNQLYITVGDMGKNGPEQNIFENNNTSYGISGNEDKSSAIVRITINGSISHNNPFDEKGFEWYFAYGIRNALGLAFDPIGKNLWDIEQGSNKIDEINLVKSGFNSGWKKIQGYSNHTCCSSEHALNQDIHQLNRIKNSYYDDPQMVSSNGENLTGIVFMNNSTSGSNYDDVLYVGDMKGNIYKLHLDEKRERIISTNNLSNNIFASGFGPISDLKVDQNGILYVLTYSNGTDFSNDEKTGALYGISLKNKMNYLSQEEIINYDHLGIIWTFIIIVTLLMAAQYKRLIRYIRR